MDDERKRMKNKYTKGNKIDIRGYDISGCAVLSGMTSAHMIVLAS